MSCWGLLKQTSYCHHQRPTPVLCRFLFWIKNVPLLAVLLFNLPSIKGNIYRSNCVLSILDKDDLEVMAPECIWRRQVMQRSSTVECQTYINKHMTQ